MVASLYLTRTSIFWPHGSEIRIDLKQAMLSVQRLETGADRYTPDITYVPVPPVEIIVTGIFKPHLGQELLIQPDCELFD
jgi:hypothetical protein